MPLYGELFISEVLKRPVYDPKAEIVGKVRDAIIVKGEPLPTLSAIIVEKKRQLFKINWPAINIFNKIIISTVLTATQIEPYAYNDDDILVVRDILDKQIVDVNEVKVVRVNDIKFEGFRDDAIFVAVDVGMRGIFRRLGVEGFFNKFNIALDYNLITWNYIQALKPKMKAISLTVPRQMLSELHPADIAEIITHVARDEGTQLFKDLDTETAAEALSELKPQLQAEIIDSMDAAKAADIIEEMPPDEAADVLSDLPAEKAKELLEHIEKEEAEDIQELLGHESDTAGGLMTNEFIAYPPTLTVKEAIERFRQDAKEMETVYYLYVIAAHEKLLGVTTLRDVLMSDPATRLEDIMHVKLKTVGPDEDEKEVAEMISKYGLFALPVVDTENTLLGIVTIDDIMTRLVPTDTRKKGRKM